MRPVTDAELERLAAALDEHGAFDLDGTLGLLHAVAVGPSLLQPSSWLPVVLPQGLPGFDANTGRDILGVVMRLYNEVLGGLDRRVPLMPDEDDVTGRERFAAGFVRGAELDTQWLGDDQRWTYAAWAALLGNRHELLDRGTLEGLDGRIDAAKDAIRRQMAELLVKAQEAFLDIREAQQGEVPDNTPARSIRVGRNEPCPCGSGKKYKRCCIARG